MPGMYCDSCGELFQYSEQIVVLRDTGNGVEARYTMEREGGTIGETYEPRAKYHIRCYETMREQQPDSFPELP